MAGAAGHGRGRLACRLEAPAYQSGTQDPAGQFLGQTHSAIRNLQVDTDDVYGVMAAFDRSWDSGVPFSIVIDPQGKVIYRHAGEVDVLELRRVLLAHLPDAGPFAGNADYWRH